CCDHTCRGDHRVPRNSGESPSSLCDVLSPRVGVSEHAELLGRAHVRLVTQGLQSRNRLIVFPQLDENASAGQQRLWERRIERENSGHSRIRGVVTPRDIEDDGDTLKNNGIRWIELAGTLRFANGLVIAADVVKEERVPEVRLSETRI